MTKLKICGLREVGHALTAADAGADFLGFVFVPGVGRQITQQRAAAIIEDYRHVIGTAGPRLVGLFADQPVEDVNRIVRSCGLDLAQLCGYEPPDYWEQVEVPIIRQVKVRERPSRCDTIDDALRQVGQVASRGHTPLLDRHEFGRLGGTGRTFDWTIASDVARKYEFLLAGGLTPDNVGQAIATVDPWGVDVSSGVETDGAKDKDKIVLFAEQVRQASD